MLFFISLLDCCFRRSEFNNILLYPNEEEETQRKEHQHPCLILLEFRHSSPLCKNHKKPKVDKKSQTCETLTLTEGFIFSSYRCSKQLVSRSLTLNWSELLIPLGCFQICSGNNNTSWLYACENIHLISKAVTSLYVQE